jgi:mRNA-degrading endonuclease RelE of RelBE toxin-antitoxin system
MFALEFTGQFRKDLKRIKKRNQDIFFDWKRNDFTTKNGIEQSPKLEAA